MEQSYIFLIVTIFLLVCLALFSLGLIAKSKENDYNFALSPARSKYFGCLGLFSSVLFAIVLIFGIANGWYDPQNQTETKPQAVTSVELKDDIMTIHNNDNYKIIIDFRNNSTEIYHNSKKLEGVRNSFYKISKKLNIRLLFYLLICYNSVKEVIRND